MGLVNFEFYDDILVIALSGEITGYNSDMLVEEFQKFFVSSCPDKIVVDFTGALHIDSTGISAILYLRRNRDKGLPIRLCGISGNIRIIFDQIHLSKLFDIFDNLDDGVKTAWEKS